MQVFARLAATLLLAAGVLAQAGSRAQEEPRFDPSPAQERIAALRAEGDLAGATAELRALELEAARLDWLPDWFRGDLARLSATLESIAALSAEARAELAEAARLGRASEESFERGDRAAARDEAERAVALLERHLGAEHAETTWERIDLAWACAYVQDVAGFLAQAERAVSATGAAAENGALVGPHPLAAAAQAALGYAELQAGRLGAARASFEAAREIWAEVDSPLDLYMDQRATPSNGLALIAGAEGRTADQDALFRECEAFVRRAPGEESETYASLLNNIATAYVQRGELARAEPLLERSLALKLELGVEDPTSIARSLSNLAVLYMESGDFSAADEAVEQALRTVGSGLGRDLQVAVLLGNLARANLLRGRLDRAEELAGSAAELARGAFAHEPREASAWIHTLGEVRLERGDLDGAAALFEEALALATVGGATDELARAAHLDASGRIALRRGERDAGRARIETALELRRGLLAPSHPALASGLLELARLDLEAGELERAAERAAEAADMRDRGRAGARAGLARAAYGATRAHAVLASLRAALDEPEAAFAALERGRGRTLLDLLQAAGAIAADPDAARRRDELADALARAAARLEALVARGSAGDEPAAVEALEARAEVLELEVSLAALAAELESQGALPASAPYSLARVRAALLEDEALVTWVEGHDARGTAGLWAVTVRRDAGARTAFAPSGGLDLGARLAAFRDELAEAALSPFPPSIASARAAGREVFELLLAPALAAGHLDGARHLVVVPAAPVLGVPLEAAADGAGRFADERWSISYAPSASVHAWLAERAAPAGDLAAGPALVLADPPFRAEHLAAMAREETGEPAPAGRRASPDLGAAPASLPRLAASRGEAEAVAARFGRATALLGRDAREGALELLDLSGFRAVHVATHALVDDDRPERSALVLSQMDLPDPLGAALRGAASEDGLVTAGEIAARWRLGADLVALSACETALGRKVPGEGYLGLSTALLEAGARSVVASLWSVDDRAAARFMQELYAAWLEGEGAPRAKAEALRAARAALRARVEDGRRPFEHPGAWAAFVLIGDPR